MRYFFLAYAIIAILFVGMMGFRGQKFHKPPIQVFPDMDDQDVLRAQNPSSFFADRHGERMPVDETQPRGFNQEGESTIGGIPEYEFSGLTGYYYTGHVGDYYGSGMPEELELDAEKAAALIRRGEERFGIYCAVCHGTSGDGMGVTSRYGVPGIANLHLGPFKSDTYPDGRMFEVITKGKGQMGSYGANVAVRDRWAIVAYVRTLQAAKEKADAEAAKAAEEAPAEEAEPAVGPSEETDPAENPADTNAVPDDPTADRNLAVPEEDASANESEPSANSNDETDAAEVPADSGEAPADSAAPEEQSVEDNSNEAAPEEGADQ